MRALFFFLLSLFSTAALAQEEVRYFSKNFQTVQVGTTPFERRYFPEENKIKIEDYEYGKLKQKSLVEGTLLSPEADAYLWYVRNPAEYYLKDYFPKLKASIGRLTNAGKPAYEAYAYGKNIRYGQVWDESNAPVLVKGNGLSISWAQDKTEKVHGVYKDSVLVSSYIHRLPQKDTLYITLDQMPMPKNGMTAFRMQLANSIEYPEAAKNEDKEATVYIQFTVDENGRLREFKTLDQAGFGFEKNAIKKLEAYPAWSPPMLGGRAVKTRHTVPIVFRLE